MVFPVDTSVTISNLHPGGSNMFKKMFHGTTHCMMLLSNASEMQH